MASPFFFTVRPKDGHQTIARDSVFNGQIDEQGELLAL
jgi:hypothetical protein